VVTAATPSITLDAVIAGVADEDYIVRQGNLGNELNGLRFLINATSVYANVDPATVPNWAALTVGSSTTPVSEVLFDQASEKPGTDGDGSNPSLYIVEQDQRRKLASQLQAQKRYDGKQSTLKGGWKGLDLEYGTLVADRFCPSNDGFAINPEKIARFVGLDFTWDDDDGKILYKALDGSDAVEARYKAYINLETPVRNAHTRITFSTATF
jgi:hypothetical protein